MNIFNPREIIQESDIEEIKKLLHGIIGEQCWGGRLSFGNELRFEIGAKQPDLILRNKEKGSWRLGACASKWYLENSNSILASSEEESIIAKQKLKMLDGYNILDFDIGWPKLSLTIFLENQLSIKVDPVWDNSSKLAHWEIFMPASMILRVGPRATWSYFQSNIPINKR